MDKTIKQEIEEATDTVKRTMIELLENPGDQSKADDAELAAKKLHAVTFRLLITCAAHGMPMRSD